MVTTRRGIDTTAFNVVPLVAVVTEEKIMEGKTAVATNLTTAS